MPDGTIAPAMNFYLLAGGESRRMQVPKESLELEGSSFFDRIREAAAPLFDEVIAVRRQGTAPLTGVRNIFDGPHDGSAAIYGILRALEDSPSDKLWICAVDRPLLTRGLLIATSERFRRSSSQLLAIRTAGRLDLLFAGWSRSLQQTVRSHIETGRLRLQDLAEAADLEVIDDSELSVEERNGLANVNIPEEYDLLRSRYDRT